MGISIAEFQVAMETYGAERLPDRKGTRFKDAVPCFYVRGITFVHSGTNYIVQQGAKAPKEVIKEARAELGEKYLSGENFWFDGIHSVRGLLTLAAMLENKYSKEWINELTNTTYKRLLENSVIQQKDACNRSRKMAILYQKLAEFDSVVNPFGNENLTLKDPIEYLDNIKVSIESEEGKKPAERLSLKSNSVKVTYDIDANGWDYAVDIDIWKNGKEGYINVSHYFKKGYGNEPDAEIVHVYYDLDINGHEEHDENIDIRLNLKTVLAWQTYREKKAKPVTCEQIDTITDYFTYCIKKIKETIIRQMVRSE